MTTDRNDRPPTTVVTAGTGKTGRRVLHRLRDLGVPVRAGSRAGSPAFDWQVPDTWAPLLAGAGAVYLAYAPDLAEAGAGATVAAFTALATRLGVGRLVVLSGRGEPGAQAAEQQVRDAAVGAAVTVVRASWFMQNFSEDFLRDAVLSGELALPVAAVGEPFIDADDIAAVAVAALTEPGHDGQLYEVTGPRLLTFAEVADEISAATGRPVGARTVPLDGYLDALRQHGVPENVVGLLGLLFTETLDGRNAWVGDGVQRALGRPPRDVRDWARATAAAGAWATDPALVGARALVYP